MFKGLEKDEVISANYNDNIFPVKCTALHEIGTRSASKNQPKKLVKTQNILDDSIFVMLDYLSLVKIRLKTKDLGFAKNEKTKFATKAIKHMQTSAKAQWGQNIEKVAI